MKEGQKGYARDETSEMIEHVYRLNVVKAEEGESGGVLGIV